MRVRPEYDFKVIGQNLKALRLASDLSVEEVKDYMQLGTVQAVYKWERGDGLPQADTLIALMDLYGENRIDKLTEEGKMLSFNHFLELFNFALNDKSARFVYDRHIEKLNNRLCFCSTRWRPINKRAEV